MRKITKGGAMGGIKRATQALPKGRITPGYKMPDMKIKTSTPTTMPKKKTLPKKGMPMNYKNPKYRPSNGVGVGM